MNLRRIRANFGVSRNDIPAVIFRARSMYGGVDGDKVTYASPPVAGDHREAAVGDRQLDAPGERVNRGRRVDGLDGHAETKRRNLML
jgi:hypothetical protein